MRITRNNLIRIAKETAEKAALSDPGLVAAYLTGSLRSDDPFLGNTTDIDIVFVHAEEPKTHRQFVPLTPEIHLDITHNPRSLYEKPKELRIHPWLGPELYDPLPLYVTRHFFEFIQAGVRDRYHDSANVQLRAQQLLGKARMAWQELSPIQGHGPQQVSAYLNSIHLAANAVALLADDPLSERRFLIQFPARARSAGKPELTGDLFNLLGAHQVDAPALADLLPEWEKAFLDAAARTETGGTISVVRLGYYKLAFEFLLAGETPQVVIWPLLLTWTQTASIISSTDNPHWRSLCGMLGLDEGSFGERLEELDLFLDSIEALQESLTVDQGL
jgi:hypothetical protein